MSSLIPAYVDGVLAPVDKLEVHQRGLRHPAVSVFVMQDNRMLLQKRAAHKYHTPGLWTNACCTHPHWGERASACATRRLDEELGLRGLSMRHMGVIEYRADVFRGLIEHEVAEIFAAEVHGPISMALNPEEVDEVAWVPLDKLESALSHSPERYTPWLRVYMAQHREMILGHRAGGETVSV
jgi:isopentenyl-diphosphate Delta-isomerase